MKDANENQEAPPVCFGMPYERVGASHIASELLRRRLGDECEQYPRANWRNQVARGFTDEGYWTWVTQHAMRDETLEAMLSLSAQGPRRQVSRERPQ